jgi:hypothetical protein
MARAVQTGGYPEVVVAGLRCNNRFCAFELVRLPFSSKRQPHYINLELPVAFARKTGDNEEKKLRKATEINKFFCIGCF